ncbi:hypothetical protein LO762_24365 [Actinocorallia sp. API 0066]|uniref:hypothetical protein n=1 Tax=Actinocorallia sp. API 0066 TaxID=2896846 RepID=UPI001E3C71E9|nr:hypothetical protein [Actinocorallia sp. API 0066]MCD0452303.1 hypothetical protein [Actinocorallia sp. API 0066]
MDDRQLVEALRARDPGALASVYDAYAEPLYAYCWFRLTNAEAAQVALRDTFIVAEAHADRLHDVALFRPWLYAIARSECARRPFPTSPPDLPAPEGDRREADQRLIAWRAVRALEPRAREALELETLHKLSVRHASLVLTVPERQTQALLADGRNELRSTLTVELLSHLGPFGCASRADILAAGEAGEVDANVRANLLAHVKACPECAVHRPTEAVSPAKIFAMVPSPAPPAGLRAKVMSCFTDPDLVGYRLFVATRSTDFTPLGFPGHTTVPLDEEPKDRARWWRRILVVGVLSGGLIAGTTFVGWLVGDPRHDVRTIASGGTPGSRPAPSGDTADDRPRPPEPRDGALPARLQVGGKGAAASDTAATPHVKPPAHTPQSAELDAVAGAPERPGTLTVSPLRLDLGADSVGTLRLSADDDLVWRAKVKGPMRLSEPSGRLAKDQKATVKVRVLRTAEDGAGKGTIRLGRVTVTVTWTSALPPTGQPASPPHPATGVPPTSSPAHTAPAGTPTSGPVPAPTGTGTPEPSPSLCPPEEHPADEKVTPDKPELWFPEKGFPFGLD